jgi:hypothetical protein
MGSFLQRRSVRICRVTFRWCRISVWFLILLAVMACGYLHWVGLPDFLKKPILAHLREGGFEAQFSSMRLGWGPSIIIKDAFFQRYSQQPEPQLRADRADLEMTWLDLARAKVGLKSLEVYDGKLQFPAAGQSNSVLSFDDIHLELLFINTNFVRLTNTMATFRGMRLDLNGEISHAEAVRRWHGLGSGRARASWQAILARVTDILDHVHFAKTPRINFDFSADARDLDTIRGNLDVTAPDVSTPWGDARKIRLEATCAHLLSTNEPILRVNINADEAATPWTQGSEILLTALCSKDEQFNIETVSRISCDKLDGNWGTNSIQTSDFRWDGTAMLNSTNFHLLRAQGDLRASQADSSWGSAQDIRFTVIGETNDPPGNMGPDWGFWTRLTNYRFGWTMTGTSIDTPKIKLDSLKISGEWAAPLAIVKQLDCALYGGALAGDAQLDVGTREVIVDANATFDERRVAHLMTPAARHWFSQFDWEAPPNVSAQLRLNLPAWTNRHPEWAMEVRPSLQIAGTFSAPHGGSFRGVPVNSAHSHFAYTNRVWTLPNLTASRPDGDVTLSYRGSDATHEYYFLVDSAMDPNDVRPLLPTTAQRWFDEVKLSAPPTVHAEIWGRWHAPELTGVRAQIEVSNFIAHGESVESFSAGFDYTNRFFRLYDARLVKGGEYATVGLAEADLASKRVYVTNMSGVATLDLVRRVSSPRTPKFLQAIQFDNPPSVRLSGSFEIGNPLATDMRFNVSARGFRYTNLLADSISGDVRWRGRNVLVTNVQAGVYNTGSLVGWCMFDYKPKHGTDFKCQFNAKDIDLPVLAAGLTGRTNKLEGMLDGNLVMIDANSTNERTWNGFGHVHVHNALLWDIKLFGIFSPILNAVNPGAGNSRAYDASADFAVTNGVLTTDDLVVHSTGFRLNYAGTVNSQTKQIDARAEAELLRDTKVLGPMLSTMLSPLSRLFAYKITGTLRNPKIAPMYIPAPLMLLFRPFHTLKMWGDSAIESAGSSAAPPVSQSKK